MAKDFSSVAELAKDALTPKPMFEDEASVNTGEEATQDASETPKTRKDGAPNRKIRGTRKTRKQDDSEAFGKDYPVGNEVPRINIALTPENYEFLKECSGLVYGSRNMTHLINILIAKFRKEKAEVFARAKAIREELES